MSLYDDFDTIKQKDAAGWSSGIKLFQSQLDKLKKTAKTQRKREQSRKGAVLPPVADLKSKRDEDENQSGQIFSPFLAKDSAWTSGQPHSLPLVAPNRDLEMHVEGEYDPMWPNDYEKVVIELKEKREREKLKEEDERRKRGSGRRESRFDPSDSDRPSGMSARPSSDDEEEGGVPKPNLFGAPRSAGVAIAPPPSLVESSPPSTPEVAPPSKVASFGGSSVAAKIMAKYGFKEGQGLGKKEQGIASALQVEKTSKRGGRIINEKAMMPPPPQGLLPPGPGGPANPLGTAAPGTPLGPPPPPGGPAGPGAGPAKPEPTITEIMRSPSKAVLLRNMVGPGEVDDDLEPEVKDECNSKYGEVVQVIIFEVPNNPADEAVRIFVEFKRIESAIKAVVDLNGRFFGGRQVKAGFYSCEKLKNLQLLD